MDAGLVGDAHLLAYPFLAETFEFCIPEAVLLGYVGMLALTMKATTMLAGVVFVGATVLGSRTCSVSAPTLVTVCCCVPGVVACAVARLTCQGFTVRLGRIGSTIFVINGLLLEQGGQVGGLVGDGVG